MLSLLPWSAQVVFGDPYFASFCALTCKSFPLQLEEKSAPFSDKSFKVAKPTPRRAGKYRTDKKQRAGVKVRPGPKDTPSPFFQCAFCAVLLRTFDKGTRAGLVLLSADPAVWDGILVRTIGHVVSECTTNIAFSRFGTRFGVVAWLAAVVAGLWLGTVLSTVARLVATQTTHGPAPLQGSAGAEGRGDGESRSTRGDRTCGGAGEGGVADSCLECVSACSVEVLRKSRHCDFGSDDDVSLLGEGGKIFLKCELRSEEGTGDGEDVRKDRA